MRDIPSFVTIKTVTVTIGDRSLEAFTCSDSCNAFLLYHSTTMESIRSILDQGYMRTMTGERQSGHISFTLNPNLHYGSGNMRMTFYPSTCKYLSPMRYYDEEIYGTIVDEIVNDRRKELEKQGKKDLPTNFIIADVGLMPKQYSYECEWYTKRMVPVNKKFVKNISFMIPWQLCSREKHSRCEERIWPKYSVVGYDKHCNIKNLEKEISRMKERVAMSDIDFSVDSTFPFIEDSLNDKRILLDDENLRRLTAGESVIYSDLSREEMEKKHGKCRY